MAAMMSRLKAAVIGPGGIGGMIGVLLGSRGNIVSCIGSPNKVAEKYRRSLHLRSHYYGNFSEDLYWSDSIDFPVDVIFFTVKAPSLINAINRVSTHICQKAIVISLLNGLGHQEILRDRFANVVIGTIGSVESEKIHNGLIQHNSSNAARIELAQNQSVDDARLSCITERMNESGLETVIRNDETQVIWGKLSRLCPLSSITSYFREPLGEILINPKKMVILENLIAEVVIVAKSFGYETDCSTILKQINSLPFDLSTSMQKDLEAQNSSEIEAILGEVVRKYKLLSTKRSTLESVYNTLLER